MPDGTIHLVYTPERTPGLPKKSDREQIFGANDNLLWEGLSKDRPYEYLPLANQLRQHSSDFTQQRMIRMQMITPEFSAGLSKYPAAHRRQPGRFGGIIRAEICTDFGLDVLQK